MRSITGASNCIRHSLILCDRECFCRQATTTNIMKTTLQMNRRGEFTVSDSQAADHQCVKTGHRKYYYACRIKLEDPALDSRGFIADHEEINDIVQGYIKAGNIPSCEVLASGIAKAVSEYLISKDVRHTEVYMQLMGTRYPAEATAFMEAWATPEESDWINAPEAEKPTEDAPKRVIRVMTREEMIAKYGSMNDIPNWNDKGEQYLGRVLSEEDYVKVQEVKEPEWSSVSAILPWSGNFYIDERHLIIEEPKEETAPAPVEEKKVLRWMTIEEMRADSTVDMQDSYAKSRNRQGKNGVYAVWSMDDIQRLAGKPLTDAEAENYHTNPYNSAYVRPTHGGDGSATGPRWMVTDKPLPEAEASSVQSQEKKYRFMTLEEVLAIPGVMRKQHYYEVIDVPRIASYGSTMSSMRVELINELNGRDLTPNEVRQYLHPNRGDNAYFSGGETDLALFATVTDKPLPVKKYRIRKYEDMLQDPKLYADEEGDIWTVDRREAKYFFDKSTMSEMGGRVLTEAEQEELEETGRADFDSYWVEKWMTEEHLEYPER